MKCAILLFLITFLLLPLVSAETTFFDNSKNFFIMGSSSSDGVTGGTTDGATGGTTGGGGCLYKWSCTEWSKCLPSEKQTRNCVNVGTCSDTYKTPETEQDCTYASSPESEKEKINGKEIVNSKILIYLIVSLLILSIVFYLKKDYFKKIIQKTRK